MFSYSFSPMGKRFHLIAVIAFIAVIALIYVGGAEGVATNVAMRSHGEAEVETHGVAEGYACVLHRLCASTPRSEWLVTDTPPGGRFLPYGRKLPESTASRRPRGVGDPSDFGKIRSKPSRPGSD